MDARHGTHKGFGCPGPGDKGAPVGCLESMLAGAAAGVLAFAVLATLSVNRRGVR
jgi:hypothetical protein